MSRLTLATADDPERTRASKRQLDCSRCVYVLSWKYYLLLTAPEIATEMA